MRKQLSKEEHSGDWREFGQRALARRVATVVGHGL